MCLFCLLELFLSMKLIWYLRVMTFWYLGRILPVSRRVNFFIFRWESRRESRRDLNSNRSRRVFGRRDFEISTRSWRESCELLAGEISRSRRDLSENLGEFLAGEISRSRRDLAEILKSRRPKTRRDSRRDLGKISLRSRSKFCRGV